MFFSEDIFPENETIQLSFTVSVDVIFKCFFISYIHSDTRIPHKETDIKGVCHCAILFSSVFEVTWWYVMNGNQSLFSVVIIPHLFFSYMQLSLIWKTEWEALVGVYI